MPFNFSDKTETIHVALVACGNKTEEALISVKSAMMFSKSKLHYHIFTDEHLKEDFHATVKDIIYIGYNSLEENYDKYDNKSNI